MKRKMIKSNNEDKVKRALNAKLILSTDMQTAYKRSTISSNRFLFV